MKNQAHMQPAPQITATGLSINVDKIPVELKQLRQWVLWRLEERNGRPTKIPYRPNGRRADVTSPRSWSTFDDCLRMLRRGGFSGLGFVFAKSKTPYAGIDLDKCRDPKTGETEEWARQILIQLNTYTELSQSGQGWHAIVKGSVPQGCNRAGRVEMYDHDRFFVMTGKRAANSCAEIQARDLANLHARLAAGELDPAPVHPVARRNTSGTDRSPSGKDFALIGSIARELCTSDAKAIEAELRRRNPEYYADREFAKQRRGGYWAYSIERFLKYRRDWLFRKAAHIDLRALQSGRTVIAKKRPCGE